MRVLQGTAVVEIAALPDPGGRPVAVDLGCGDGRFAYERAKADPESFYIGVDPDADALAEYAYKASRKPARGGVGNVLYVVAAAGALPAALAGVADIVYVNFPWGGLLRGLLAPEFDTVAAVVTLGRAGSRFEVVVTFDAGHDAAVFGEAPGPALDEDYIRDVLGSAYAKRGLDIGEIRELTREEALAIPSTWGRRLLHGRPRHVFWIAGTVAGPRA